MYFFNTIKLSIHLFIYLSIYLLFIYQDANCATVEKVLSSVPEAEAIKLAQALDLPSCEVLLKYVYKLMSKSALCGLALKLQAALHEKVGPGGVMRVIADRKTV